MQIEKNPARRDEEHMEWEQERYKAALNAKYGKAPLTWEYGKGDWKQLRAHHIASLSVLNQDPRTTLSYDLRGLRLSELRLRDEDGLPELQLRVVEKFWEDESAPSEFTERHEAMLPEVLNLFRKSESGWLWLRQMYDSVFPENTGKIEEDAWKGERNRRKLAQHRRVWQSINALGLKHGTVERAYQETKPAPLLHTIYSAPKRIARDGETWDYVPWKGNSRFTDRASAEDRAQCCPADLSIAHVLGFSETDQPVCEETADRRTLRQSAALAWIWKWDGLPLLEERYNRKGVSQGSRIGRISGAVPRYEQEEKGFGKKFFEMPLDGDRCHICSLDKAKWTDDERCQHETEGEFFQPLTESGKGWIMGRELGRSDATLVFDKTTSTFCLQKVKQTKKAAIRGEVIRKERKRADAKLSLFSLSALKKGSATNKKGGAAKLLRLWDTATERTLHHNQQSMLSEKFTSVVDCLRDDKALMQRFLNLAVKFCTQQAAASIKYNPAVSLSAHRRMNLEEQGVMICNSSELEVTEDYAKWVARAYALLMLPTETLGSVRGLGWPDHRSWETFRDFYGRSPASASPAKEWKEDQEEEEETVETEEDYKTVIKYHRRLRFGELRTAVDQPRVDDWEGSEQQQISNLSTFSTDETNDEDEVAQVHELHAAVELRREGANVTEGVGITEQLDANMQRCEWYPHGEIVCGKAITHAPTADLAGVCEQCFNLRTAREELRAPW